MSEYRRVATLATAYDITVTVNEKTVTYTGRTRREAAMYLSIAKDVDGVSVTLDRRWIYYETTVTVCAACLARPSNWEMDCDGPYDTVSCGVCDWWAAHWMRYGKLPTY